jgi:hypothetical protein
MNADLDSRVTASLLESGWILANAGHAAALVAGFGSVAAHHATARLLFSSSMLCWLVECWFAVRVLIDTSLFRHLAGEPEDAWGRLDELMGAWGFLRARQGRRPEDRSRGAMALWRRQAIALGMQLAILIAAVVLQATTF